MKAKMEFTGDAFYVVVNGKRVAERGRVGTPHEGTWISLEPGFVVRNIDIDGQPGIEIEFIKGERTRVH